ncbi:MAG: hypothetical protein D6791_17920 [Chloroflexi bacterium]|nr:MAG: hypothetical protein D6791_17920 [Chloroflexota bacterium]
MIEERIERTFETGATAEVEISNVVGSIEVQGWDQPEVQIIAVKRGNDGDATVEIGSAGKRVWARTHTARRFQHLFRWLRRNNEDVTVDYTVCVPHASTVSVNGISGPIHIAEVHQGASVDSVDGHILLEDLAGEIAANTVESSVEGDGLAGTLDVETIAGYVELSDSQLSRLHAKSVDGSIRAAGQIDNLLAEAVNGTVHLTSSLNPEGRYVVKTVNGRFRLAVPDETACEVRAAGMNLTVRCDLPHRIEEKRWGRWAGQVNDGGGAQVEFDTVNGKLIITSAEARGETTEESQATATSEEPMPATPEAADHGEAVPPEDEAPEVPSAITRMDILKAVERGEIDVEDALEKLQRLNEPAE